MNSQAKILLFYSAFLFASSFGAFAYAGFKPKAKTALIVGGGCSVLAVIAGLISSGGSPIGGTAGLFLSVAYATLFAWRASKLIGNREKQWLMWLFVVLCAGSLVTFGSLYSARNTEGSKPKAN